MTNAKHNNPPDPIDEATAPYADAISEAQNWLDGEPVENEGQMKAVDALTKQIKAAIKDTKAGQKSESAPHFDAHKAAIARWKPTIDDLTLLSTGLVACVSGYKQKLADEKAAEQRKAWEEADEARREAERLAREASASDIDAQREAQAAQQAAIETEKAAKTQAKDTVKGMRKVHKYEIIDHRAALHFIAKNYRDDMTAFVENWVQKNHKAVNIDGVEQRVEKEAF
jgi:hypothetical protein